MPSFKKPSKEKQPPTGNSKKKRLSSKGAKNHSKLSKETSKEKTKQETKPSMEKTGEGDDSEAEIFVEKTAEQREKAKEFLRKHGKVDQKTWETQVIEPILSTGLSEMINQFNLRKPPPLDKLAQAIGSSWVKTGKHRYKDIGCCEQTRVKINVGREHYIHANYVIKEAYVKTSREEGEGFCRMRCVPKLICTQAPTDKTRPVFWCMVWEQNIEEIVMLCNYKEDGAVVCARFFPESVDDVRNFERIRIECIQVQNDTNLCTRVYEITKTSINGFIIKNIEPRKVKHLHYTNAFVGPDAPPLSFLQYNTYTRVILCSDGVGRTGIAAYFLFLSAQVVMWDEERKRKKTDTPQPLKSPIEILQMLREKRYGAIQTVEQFALALKMILEHKFKNETPSVHLEPGKQ